VETSLGARHPSAILLVVVIVAEEVQQAMEREDAQLGCVRMPAVARLTPRDARRDDDVAEEPGFAVRPSAVRRTTLSPSALDGARDDRELIEGSKKRGSRFEGGTRLECQNVRRSILPPVLSIESADVPIAYERDHDVTANACGGDTGQPPGETAVADRTPAAIRDRHAQAHHGSFGGGGPAPLARAPGAQRRHAVTVGIHRTIRTP
jgi:hypothetical protein